MYSYQTKADLQSLVHAVFFKSISVFIWLHLLQDTFSCFNIFPGMKVHIYSYLEFLRNNPSFGLSHTAIPFCQVCCKFPAPFVFIHYEVWRKKKFSVGASASFHNPCYSSVKLVPWASPLCTQKNCCVSLVKTAVQVQKWVARVPRTMLSSSAIECWIAGSYNPWPKTDDTAVTKVNS